MDKAITQAEALCTMHMNLVGLNDKVILPKRQQDLPKQTEGAWCFLHVSALLGDANSDSAELCSLSALKFLFFLKELMYMGQQ